MAHMTYQEIVEFAEARLFIIAEAGVNHNGSIEAALRLVDAAVAAGCDAVKFQTWITEKVYSRTKSIKPDYQLATTNPDEAEFDTIKSLELTQEDFRTIRDYCAEKEILFFSTPDEVDSADFLLKIGVRLMKTASQDVTNTPFLSHIAGLGVPVIFSTGACTMAELAEGAQAILAKTQELIILHCVSSYPAPVEQMNISLIPKLSSIFGCPVGLSDHTTGAEVACAAVALGARVFEKHLTLDKTMPGPDHQASLNPEEMADYCRTLRRVHSALGDGIKRVMPCEENTRKAFRRYLVTTRPMSRGSIVGHDDICFKKVVEGIEPRQMDLVIGSTLLHDISEDTPLRWNILQLT